MAGRSELGYPAYSRPQHSINFDTALKDLTNRTEKANPHSPLEEAVMNKVFWLPPPPQHINP
jgi:hypothetical protein